MSKLSEALQIRPAQRQQGASRMSNIVLDGTDSVGMASRARTTSYLSAKIVVCPAGMASG